MTGLLTLNISNPSRVKAQALLHWLWPREEDVWVLTEVGKGDGSRLMQAVCRQAGFDVVASDPSELGVAVISRAPTLTVEPLEPIALLPGRLQRVTVDGFDLLAAYGAASDPVRYSSAAQRRRKREWLTQFDTVVAGWVPNERGVLIGDLNIVDPRHDPALKYVLAQEVDSYHRLGDLGLRDAFLEHHPDADEASWADHSGLGCRYDHAFVTADVRVSRCELDQSPRIEGHTDHAALSLVLD